MARFQLAFKDVGVLQRLRVELYGKKGHDAWRCELITVENTLEEKVTYFACEK